MSYGGTRDYTPAPTDDPRPPTTNKKLQQTQADVDDVVGIMRTNVAKVLDRDEKLSALDTRAEALQHGASQFETQATRLKRKYWWKNCKMWAILIIVILVIIIIIVVVVVTSNPPSSSPSPGIGTEPPTGT